MANILKELIYFPDATHGRPLREIVPKVLCSRTNLGVH